MRQLQSLLCYLTIKGTFGQPIVYPLDHPAPFPTENGVIDYHQTVVYSLTKNGSVAWKFDAARPIEAAVLGPDGTFFIGTRNGSLYALTADGHAKWEFTANCSFPEALHVDRCFVLDAIHVDSNGKIFLRTAGFKKDDSPPPLPPPVPGNLSVLSPSGELIWSAKVAPMTRYARYGSPLLGKNTSQDLVFVATSVEPQDAISYRALSKSDGKVRWSIINMQSLAVAGDGALVGVRDSAISKYSAEGHLLWSYDLPPDTAPDTISPGPDGTVYANFYGANAPGPGGILALSSNGKLKWNITRSYSNEVGYPSEQNDKGDIFLSYVNGTKVQGGLQTTKVAVVIVHPDGSQSRFHELSYTTSIFSTLSPPRPIRGPDGLVYLHHEGDIVVLQPNGDEKLTFKSGSDPVFANDGTIYIKRVDRKSGDLAWTYLVVEVDPATGSDRWQHVLSRPDHSEVEAAGNVTIYKIDSPCRVNVPKCCGESSCPAGVAHFLNISSAGYREGTCASVGYTVHNGTVEFKVPVWGKTVEISLFLKPTSDVFLI